MRKDARPWGLIASEALGLDASRYYLSSTTGNIHNTGEHGWYQGKGTVNATPINFAEFFAELPRAISGTQITAEKSKDIIKLNAALTYTRKKFIACHAAGGRVIFIGNGGSAAIASHMAVDYSKNGGVRAMAFNDVPTLTCLANDFGYDNVFSKQLEFYATKKDIAVIISSSGRSLNIVAAAKTALDMGCYLLTFTGMNPNNTLRALGDFNFWVPSADYGIVELTHLSLLHAMVDIRLPRERAALWKGKRK